MTGFGLFAIGGVSVVLLAVIVRYMRRSMVRSVSISALQFLPELASARQKRVRWQISMPLQSPLFWLRLLFLALLLAALLADGVSIHTQRQASLGVLIVVDHSPSMAMGKPSRLQLANQKAEDVRAHVSALKGCSKTIAFPSVPIGAAQAIARDGFAPAMLINSLTDSLERDQSCDWTHLVVISDLPPQAMLALEGRERTGTPPFWFQVGTPTSNMAISGAHFSPETPEGRDADLEIELEDYGKPSGPVSLELYGPDDKRLDPVEAMDLGVPGRKRLHFRVSEAGRYRALLNETGGLAIDNRFEITLNSIAAMPVILDEALSQSSLKPLLEKISTVHHTNPDQMSVSIGLFAPDAVSVKRGIFFLQGEGTRSSGLGYFDGSNELLRSVDLDLFEKMPSTGLKVVPEGFKAVVSDADGALLLAMREGDNRAVLMPLPPGGFASMLLERANQTWLVAFLNAFRYVNEDRGQITAMAHVDDTGAPLYDVAFESDVAKPVGLNPQLEDIRPVAEIRQESHVVWPWLLLAALLALGLERVLDQPLRRRI
ncbi:hypothetical protein [uncultured Cohaesibacter sp.]|uniref:hypothetical protein n=1 Tax=uncultured Cohaesibacter sp. TaxID=1002546 RepID=UPI002931EFD7|nr:hypothetical protein [uncultured Cohaesibacter sp.]